MAQRLLVVVAVLAGIGLYWRAAEHHLHHVNTDAGAIDQSAYLKYSARMVDSDYEFVGGRNRMPGYPFLLGLVYDAELEMARFFTRAKYLNLTLSLLLLPVLWALARSLLPRLEATVLAATAASGFLVFKAAYAQAEVLYYGLFFTAFVAAVHLLRRPRLRLAAGLGVILGLTHLTKASALPLLALWSAWASAGAASSWLRRWRTTTTGPTRAECFRETLAPALTIAFFIATVFPYIRTSKQVFGAWFYNVNSTFYIWYDSWEECKEGTRSAGDRRHWPDLPDEEIPSLGKYLSDHTIGDVASRMYTGGERVFKGMTRKFSYGKYPLIYLMLCILAMRGKQGETSEILISNRRWLVTGFAATSLLGYTALFAFYSPITSGARLTLSQWLPAQLCSLAFVSRYRARSVRLGSREYPLSRVHGIVLLLVAYDLALRAPDILATTFAGN
ncbi:MAG: hypothetical protein GY722_09540 [bacterium]|nr:hypothetical protein [bacterium]